MRVVIAFLLLVAPALADYSTYIGDAYEYQVAKVITDAAGDTYVIGSRLIPIGANYSNDVFVTKLDAAGNLLFTSTFGGKGLDQASDMALDRAGNIYVVGHTSSANFPLRGPLQAESGMQEVGFIVKLSADGSTLLYSTFFGGTMAMSTVNAIAVDSEGNMYVTGWTYSGDFASTPGLPTDHPSWGISSHGPAFVSKISAAGDRILFTALLGGDQVGCSGGSSCFLSGRSTSGQAIALDAAGNVYVAGNSNVTDLPTSSGALAPKGIGAFVAKINAGGTSLGYLTCLGTANYNPPPITEPGNVVNALVVDASGNAYLTGSTNDVNFPATAGAYQTSYAGPTSGIYGTYGPQSDAFIAKLDPSGSAMVWATYLGGAQPDAGQSIAVDAAGSVWVGGSTASSNFPNANGWTTGGDFVVEMDANGSQLNYAALYPTGSASQSISLCADGSIRLAGSGGLISAVTPGQAATPHVFGIANSAWGSLGGRIAPGELISIYGPQIGVGTVRVTIGGVPSKVLYFGKNQINAVTPAELTPGNPSQVEVLGNGTALPAFRVVLVDTAPQIFRNADGSAATLNQDGSVNSASNPAKAGTIVSIFATGTGASNEGCCLVYPQYGQVDRITYAGQAPGLVDGVTQINFQLPAPVSNDATLAVAIQAGRQISAFAPIYVTQ